MITLKASMKMYDGMTGPLQSIVNSMDLVARSMNRVEEAARECAKLLRVLTSAQTDAADAEEARGKELDKAAEAQRRLNEAASAQPKPPLTPIMESSISIELGPQDELLQLMQDLIDKKTQLDKALSQQPVLAPAWEHSPAVEIFQSKGLERMNQELSAAQAAFQELQKVQQQLSNADMKFLSPQVIQDVNMLEQRVMGLQGLLKQVEAAKDRLGAKAPPEVFDKMSDSVEGIRHELNQAIQTQHRMNQAMKAGDLSGVNKAYQHLNRHVETTERHIRSNVREQERFNRQVDQGKKSASRLLGRIESMSNVFTAIGQVKSFLSGSLKALDKQLKATNEQLKAEQKLQMVMSNRSGITQQGIDLVKVQAKALERTTGVASSMGVIGQAELARYVGDPANVAALTESMYNLATATHGAGFSQEQLIQTSDLMGKLMTGNLDDVAGLNLGGIFDEAQLALLKTGTEGERAALIIERLEHHLSGLAAAMGEMPEAQIARLSSAWGEVQAKIVYGVLPLLSELTAFMLANMPFIEDVVLGVFGNILSIMEQVMFAALTAGQFIVDNWGWIAPVLWGIVAAMGAFLLITKAMTAAIMIKTAAIAAKTAALAIYNATLKANPIGLIISLVLGFIMVLIRLWQTNDSFVEGFMQRWNSILNFFDQIPIFFTKVAFGIINAFQNVSVSVLQIMEQIINGVIDGINLLIGTLNRIPGVSINAVGHVNFTSQAAASANAIRQVGHAAVNAMQLNAAANAAARDQALDTMMNQRAADRAAKDAEKASRFAAPDLPGMAEPGLWNNKDGLMLEGGKLDQVGSIRDSVDISSEDLKTMRELAEMKNIQNFVTLTPTVQMTTGPIQNGQDVNSIVAAIRSVMEEEIASSAEGVYG